MVGLATLNIGFEDLVIDEVAEETSTSKTKKQTEKWDIRNVPVKCTKTSIYIPRVCESRCDIKFEKNGFVIKINPTGFFPIKAYHLRSGFLFSFYERSEGIKMDIGEGIMRINAPLKKGVTLKNIAAMLERSCRAQDLPVGELVPKLRKNFDGDYQNSDHIVSFVNNGERKYIRATRIAPKSNAKKEYLRLNDLGTSVINLLDKEFTVIGNMDRVKIIAKKYLGNYKHFVDISTGDDILALDEQLCSYCGETHNSALEYDEREEVCETCSLGTSELSKYIQIVRLQSEINRKTLSVIEEQKTMISEQNDRIRKLEIDASEALTPNIFFEDIPIETVEAKSEMFEEPAAEMFDETNSEPQKIEIVDETAKKSVRKAVVIRKIKPKKNRKGKRRS